MGRRMRYTALLLLLAVVAGTLLYRLFILAPQQPPAPPAKPEAGKPQMSKPSPAPEPAREPEPRPTKYPSGVPEKFTPDGKVQRFPGNTIICPLPATSPLYTALLRVYERLRAEQDDQHGKFPGLYVLLPPSSWHMTVFEGVLDFRRGVWPDDLGPDEPLGECNAFFAWKLAGFDLATPLPYRCRVDGWTRVKNGISLRVTPSWETGGATLRGLRDRLSEVLRIRAGDHDGYGFHVSLAYLLRYPSEGEREALGGLLEGFLGENGGGLPREFELGAPAFCTFEDMFAFEPVLFLGNRTEGDGEGEGGGSGKG